jgi:hypothetical protein
MSIRDRKRWKIPGFQASIDIPGRAKRGIPGPQAPRNLQKTTINWAGKKLFLFCMPSEGS